MADITNGIADAARKAFLAGVGAVAIGAEATSKLVDDLVKKGELTVDQGRDLNRELSVKAKETLGGAQDTVLKARLATMSSEERAAFVARAQELSNDLDAKDAEQAEAAGDSGEACSCGCQAHDEDEAAGESCSCQTNAESDAGESCSCQVPVEEKSDDESAKE